MQKIKEFIRDLASYFVFYSLYVFFAIAIYTVINETESGRLVTNILLVLFYSFMTAICYFYGLYGRNIKSKYLIFITLAAAFFDIFLPDIPFVPTVLQIGVMGNPIANIFLNYWLDYWRDYRLKRKIEEKRKIRDALARDTLDE